MFEKLMYSLMGICASFFMPLYQLMFWMAVLVSTDMVTGMMAAKARGEELTSAKMKKTIKKITWYALAIILLHGIDIGVLYKIELSFAMWGAGIICIVELFSNFENLYTITDNKVFYILTQWTKKTIHEKAGVKMDDEK